MLTTLKTYFNIVGMAIFSIFSFGIVIPTFISADDWFLVSLGVVLLTISPITLYYWVKASLINFKNKENMKNE